MLQVMVLMALSAGVDGGTPHASPRPLALMSNDTAVIDKWIATKPEQRGTVKGLTDKMKINERIAFAIVLDGYELPKNRRVDLTADLVVIDSTGRTVLEKVSAAGTKTWDPKTQFAVPLRPVGSLYFGTTDPEGVYTAKITVWDQIRGTHVETTQQFTVTR